MREQDLIITTNPLEIRSIVQGVSLRQFAPSDARTIFELIDGNRDHLSQFGDETATKYPTEKSVLDSITNPKNPNKLRFGIWDNGKLVGSINLTPDEEHRAEVGYYLGSKFTGKGYMGRAVITLVEYVFSELEYETLFGNVHPDNKNSQNVLSKAGFERTGSKENGDFVFTIRK